MTGASGKWSRRPLKEPSGGRVRYYILNYISEHGASNAVQVQKKAACTLDHVKHVARVMRRGGLLNAEARKNVLTVYSLTEAGQTLLQRAPALREAKTSKGINMKFTGKNLQLVYTGLELAIAELKNQRATCPDVIKYEDDLDQIEADIATFEGLLARVGRVIEKAEAVT